MEVVISKKNAHDLFAIALVQGIVGLALVAFAGEGTDFVSDMSRFAGVMLWIGAFVTLYRYNKRVQPMTHTLRLQEETLCVDDKCIDLSGKFVTLEFDGIERFTPLTMRIEDERSVQAEYAFVADKTEFLALIELVAPYVKGGVKALVDVKSKFHIDAEGVRIHKRFVPYEHIENVDVQLVYDTISKQLDHVDAVITLKNGETIDLRLSDEKAQAQALALYWSFHDSMPEDCGDKNAPRRKIKMVALLVSAVAIGVYFNKDFWPILALSGFIGAHFTVKWLHALHDIDLFHKACAICSDLGDTIRKKADVLG